MMTLREAILSAGLLPVDSDVRIDNFTLETLNRDPVQGGVSIAEPLAQMPLFPWLTGNEGARAPGSVGLTPPAPAGERVTFFYFWMPGCDNCIEGMRALTDVSSSARFPELLRTAFVAYETDGLTQRVADDIKAARLKGPVYIDLKGGLAQRLGALGSPALFLADEEGKVVARLNGEISFDSPGFDLLLATIRDYQAGQQQLDKNSAAPGLSERLRAEVATKSSPRVTFLSIPIFGWIFVGALLVVCYCMIKSVMRQRKNSPREQK